MGIVGQLQAHDAERAAIVAGGRTIDYRRFRADVDAAAAILAEAGVGVATRAGVRAGRVRGGQTYASWVVHLALIRLGAAHCSLVEQSSLDDVLAAGAIDLVVGSSEGLEAIAGHFPTVTLDLDLDSPLAPGTPPDDREAEARRINLTSGTTGTARFVTWDGAMIAARVAQAAEGLGIDGDSRLYPMLHLRTTAGFRYPLAVWAAGGTVLLPEAEDMAGRDGEALAACNLAVLSPPQLQERLRAVPGDWAGRAERMLVVLGGRLPRAVRDEALARAAGRIVVSYGATETGSIATGDAAVLDSDPGAVGHRRAGVEVEIVGPDGAALPPGETGEVRLRSPLMVPGYDGLSDDPAFRDGWFHPGDLGRLGEDGLLAIEGRVTDTFNLGGWKVNAIELENRLRAIAGIDDVAALVMPLAETDLLTFAIACREGVDLEGVARQIRGVVPSGRPFHVVRLRAIPRNAMGKIPRAEIARTLTAHYGASRANLADA